MSLNVDVESGGIIWQARRHMATSDTQPLDKNAIGFEWYVNEIATERKRRDGLSDKETDEYRNHLTEESVHYPIGRLITKEEDLPSGKSFTTHLTLLNESIGVMPDYREETNVKKIGRVTILLHAMNQHTHSSLATESHPSGLAGGMDILTNGTVNMSYLALVSCGSCWYYDLSDEKRILDKLGFESLYTDHGRREIPYKLGKRTRSIINQQFNDDQVAGLQSFLLERFSPTKE